MHYVFVVNHIPNTVQYVMNKMTSIINVIELYVKHLCQIQILLSDILYFINQT